jgi:hypothetical protein
MHFFPYALLDSFKAIRNTKTLLQKSMLSGGIDTPADGGSKVQYSQCDKWFKSIKALSGHKRCCKPSAPFVPLSDRPVAPSSRPILGGLGRAATAASGAEQQQRT